MEDMTNAGTEIFDSPGGGDGLPNRLAGSGRGHFGETSAASAYTNCNLVVAASGSQPRVGWLVMDDTSLMEI